MRVKNILLVVSVIALGVCANFFLTPYLHERETTRIVTTVLDGWVSGAIPETFQYWEDPNNTPPAYSLLSYQINKKNFDEKNGRRRAQIFVALEFSPENILPSGEEWMFELRQTKAGWKIKNFSASGRP